MKEKSTNATLRPMSAAAFRAWRKKMGFTQAQAAAVLGMSYGALARAEKDGATLYIALACAALANEINPYGISEDKLHKFVSSRHINGQPVLFSGGQFGHP